MSVYSRVQPAPLLCSCGAAVRALRCRAGDAKFDSGGDFVLPFTTKNQGNVQEQGEMWRNFMKCFFTCSAYSRVLTVVSGATGFHKEARREFLPF